MIAMKKYLIKGALALFAGALIVSCSEKETEYVPVAQQKAKAFEDVFKEVYGDNIDPYQRWGFTDQMIVANGDSVEPTVIEEIPTRSLMHDSQISSRAFTRTSPMPSTPSFRDTNPITKPNVSPSYKNTLTDAIAAGAQYARDYQDYKEGDILYINTEYQTLNNPQNTSGLTIYVDGNVTYCGQTKQDETGTVFCVTQNSTLKLGAVSNNLIVYLAPGATLNITEKLDWEGKPAVDWQGNPEAPVFTFQNAPAAIYMSAGSKVVAADLNLVNGVKVLNSGGTITANNLVLDQYSTLWNEGSINVTSTLTLTNTSSSLYNAGGKTITAGKIDLINNNALLYNMGTVTTSGAITLHNSDAEVINNATMSCTSYSQAAGGKTHNVGTMTMTGKTDLTNENSKWQNDGHWTCGSFDVDNYSHQNFNNCLLTVNGQFHLNRGTFILNAGASAVCNSFEWEDTSDFYMGGKSVLLVNGNLHTNNCNSGYGFRGYGDDYAIIQANAITHDGNEQFRMSYFGKLYIATDNHFELWYKDTSHQQPSYYAESTVMFQFKRDSCPVTIPQTSCSPGASGGHTFGDGKRDNFWDEENEEWDQVTSQSGRIFCEDLGKAAREDLDYNDVVFDVIIWKYTKTVQPMKSTTTWTTTDGLEDAGSQKTSPAVTNGSPTVTTVHYAQIILLAAGGTIPLTVAGEEVHNAFGVGVTTMVNTRDGNSTAFGAYEAKEPVEIGKIQKTVTFGDKTYYLKLTQDIQRAQDVPIIVNYGDSQVAELTANAAKAPHKLLVPFGTQWTSERKPLNLAYPNFVNYVSDASKSWVDNPVEYCLYDTRHTGLGAMPLVMKMKKNWGSESMDVLTSQTYAYDDWSLKEVYLNVDKFYPGDRLRFYGSGINADSYITVVFADGSKPYLIDTIFAESDKDGKYPSRACIEVFLDEGYCEKLNNSKKNGKIMLQVQGRSFTLDQIGRVPFK